MQQKKLFFPAYKICDYIKSICSYNIEIWTCSFQAVQAYFQFEFHLKLFNPKLLIYSKKPGSEFINYFINFWLHQKPMKMIWFKSKVILFSSTCVNYSRLYCVFLICLFICKNYLIFLHLRKINMNFVLYQLGPLEDKTKDQPFNHNIRSKSLHFYFNHFNQSIIF